jgi:hypothetical protein
MEHKCDFCGHTFANKSNLATHKKHAKYCLQLRKTAAQNYLCETCGKEFTRISTLRSHVYSCKVKLENKRDSELEELRDYKKFAESKIKELEEENAKLKLIIENGKGQLTVYKERPGLVQYINPKLVNIKCDTIQPLTIEYVQQEVSAGKYTYENYIRGERGLVDFISGLIAEDEQRSYVCTDTARNKFHRLIEAREWKEDNGANFLNNIFDSLTDPATIYYHKIAGMYKIPEEQETGDFLMDKTKKMFFGIAHPKSKDRAELFNKIRTEVRKLAAI